MAAMPQEELQRQQEQIAAGVEGPGGGGPYRGFDPFVQYLLHRLDGMEANLRGEMKQVEAKLDVKIDKLDAKIDKVDARINSLHQELHSTTRWVIGTVIAAVGAAVAVIQWLK